ncbi:hypothetical protein [Urbifossiella limnaea]|uniref:DUF1573 domain-containing protein n=1 Tax=Urbifossiella limnaea TaxID=2528023 RepID=A0A517XX93_9BACT|nr:hypothetical protein [Urbifossiella limnaea]QDU22131.1 hypothetical protein ETAA1_41070 [Urbifossiella limnaea]
MRAAACLSGLAEVVCGVLAVVEYRREQRMNEPEPPWVVAPEVLDVGEVPVGDRVLTFEMTNPADRPRRIVGLNEGCAGTVCIRSRHHGQVTVGPGETFRYECDLKVREPGPFDLRIAVFLEDGGIRTVEIGARGTGR